MKQRQNKVLGTRGSGFTKQIVEPVSSFSKQFAQPIIDRREKIKAAGGYIFFQLSRIETESLNIMKNAGLPVDDDCRFESLRRGYAHDSPVGYAATQLTICRKVRSLAAEGKFIEAWRAGIRSRPNRPRGRNQICDDRRRAFARRTGGSAIPGSDYSTAAGNPSDDGLNAAGAERKSNQKVGAQVSRW